MYCSKCGAVTAAGTAFCQVCGAPTGAVVASAGVVPASFTAARPIYAGFWLRFVAYLIDGLILGIPVGAIVVVLLAGLGFGSALGRLGEGNAADMVAFVFTGAFLAIILIAILSGWLYYALCESSSWQGTLGKKALNLAVTDLNGNRLSFGRASGRWFSKLITGMVPLAIGYIMAGFTEKKQALHDMIAGCLVIRRA